MKREPQKTKESILEAASRKFAASGYAGARIDEIAEDSGVNKRMIYHYFGDKHGLYKKVLESQMNHMFQNIRKPQGDSEYEMIRKVVEAYFDYCRFNPNYISLMIWEMVLGWETLNDIFDEVESDVYSFLIDVIRSGIQKGDFDSDTHPSLFMTLTIVQIFCFFMEILNYSLRIAPGLILLCLTYALLPKKDKIIKIFLLLFGFILIRDAMTPMGFWRFGVTDNVIWLRFADNETTLYTLGLTSLLLTWGIIYFNPRLKEYLVWFGQSKGISLCVGLLGAVAVITPFWFMYHGMPMDQRGGVPENSMLPLLCIALLGNFMEEVLFRGYLQLFESTGRPLAIRGFVGNVVCGRTYFSCSNGNRFRRTNTCFYLIRRNRLRCRSDEARDHRLHLDTRDDYFCARLGFVVKQLSAPRTNDTILIASAHRQSRPDPYFGLHF